MGTFKFHFNNRILNCGQHYKKTMLEPVSIQNSVLAWND